MSDLKPEDAAFEKWLEASAVALPTEPMARSIAKDSMRRAFKAAWNTRAAPKVLPLEWIEVRLDLWRANAPFWTITVEAKPGGWHSDLTDRYYPRTGPREAMRASEEKYVELTLSALTPETET